MKLCKMDKMEWNQANAREQYTRLKRKELDNIVSYFPILVIPAS